MAKISRLKVNSDWVDLDFMERTPEQAVELGIQMRVGGLSLLNTTSVLEQLGVERSRKAVRDWVHKADLQPDDGRSPDHIAIDETVIQITTNSFGCTLLPERIDFWLANKSSALVEAVDPMNNHLLHVQLFHSTTTAATRMLLRELNEKHDVEDSLFLVDGAQHLQTALRRSGLRFRHEKHGNRNSVERVFRKIKRRTQAFSNTFSNAQPETAEDWLQTFASWLDAN